jgi:hypothetical protein
MVGAVLAVVVHAAAALLVAALLVVALAADVKNRDKNSNWD